MKCQLDRITKLTGKNRRILLVNDIDLMEKKKKAIDSGKPGAQELSVIQQLLVCEDCYNKSHNLKPNEAIANSDIEVKKDAN